MRKLFSFELLLFVFYGYYMITSCYAVDKYLSLRLIVGILLFFFVYFVLRFYLVQLRMKTVEEAIFAAGLLFNGVSLLLYVAGMIQWHGGTPLDDSLLTGLVINRGVPRLTGVTNDPNFFVMYDSLFFFFYLSRRSLWKYRFGLMLTSSAILLTFSWGGIMAVAVGILCFVAVTGRIRFTGLLLVGMLGVLATLSRFFDLAEIWASRTANLGDASGRFSLWKHGILLLREHPIFGIGLYNFKYYNIFFFADSRGRLLHNTFLDVLVEGGFLGMALFLVALTVLISFVARLGRRDRRAVYLLPVWISMLISMLSLSAIINETFLFLLVLTARYGFEKAAAQQSETLQLGTTALNL